ncbi:uncharacterized protein VTP21DRAFT_4762 [Calcarisporiella thermophila]|uniref:uncharacterized protein n=1 Tax=Calcarisporiella thermophila TaxID=911321 RepID=UPI0037449558
MSYYGIGFSCRFIKTLDAKLYPQILDDELMATIKWYNLDKKEIIFQHDNDSKHKAKLVERWFQSMQIQVLDWPSQSPDFNPIEHLWDEVKRRLRDRLPQISGKDGLWEKVKTVWESLTKDDCVTSINTMPRRIQEVINARGGYTEL